MRNEWLECVFFSLTLLENYNALYITTSEYLRLQDKHTGEVKILMVIV